MFRKLLVFAVLAILACPQSHGWEETGVTRVTETYKTIGDIALKMHLYMPSASPAAGKRPAIVFFFGGGWVGGNPDQFFPHCEYLASRGMVALSAEYRVRSRHETPALACVQDGKSAVRWIREHADRFGIDPNRVVAAGGSAGGHVAACTGVIAGLDDVAEDLVNSSVPNAMVLYNPVAATAPIAGDWVPTPEDFAKAVKRLGTGPMTISPAHHVRAGLPPTIVFHGLEDTTVRFSIVEEFTHRMKKAGNRCELIGYEGQSHGFFNYGRGDGSHYTKTVRAMDEFLRSLGYLEGPPRLAPK